MQSWQMPPLASTPPNPSYKVPLCSYISSWPPCGSTLRLGLPYILVPHTHKSLLPFHDTTAQAFEWLKTRQVQTLYPWHATNILPPGPWFCLTGSHATSVKFCSHLWLDMPQSLHWQMQQKILPNGSTSNTTFLRVSTDTMAGVHSGKPIALILSNFHFLWKPTLLSHLAMASLIPAPSKNC